MKKILWCVMAMAVMTMFYSCKQNSNVCRIQGVVNGEQFEGKRIFLVPFTGPKSAETVDSMEIKDGKFHFETDSMQMYKILIDLRFRVGIQPLLVIGEPGEVKVVIDSVSHAVGTPQNDSLEKWKVRTEIHNRELSKMRRYIADLQQQGDTVRAKYIQQRADSLKEGVLHDFLKDMFPLTYQRKYPDGRVVTMNADTNEEIPE